MEFDDVRETRTRNDNYTESATEFRLLTLKPLFRKLIESKWSVLILTAININLFY